MGTLLTIAGFDPSSGAGVTADLAVFAAHGWFGTAAITTLTVQTTSGVFGVHPVDAQVLKDTLRTLEEDLPADGIKIGMLGSEQCLQVVVDFLEQLRERGRCPTVVVDPVVRSSSGRELLDRQTVDLLRTRLLPLVDWITPNVEEAGLLLGQTDIQAPAQILLAGLDLQARHPDLGIVITGGDQDRPDDLVLRVGEDPVWLFGTRVQTTATHGTGCAFSSALLCRLVDGDGALQASQKAKSYVVEAMRRADPRGKGRGPMNLLWARQL